MANLRIPISQQNAHWQDTRACCSNDETAGAVDGTPPRKFYGQKIAVCRSYLSFTSQTDFSNPQATVLKFLLAIKSFCRKIIQE